jgi:hypothetical protein
MEAHHLPHANGSGRWLTVRISGDAETIVLAVQLRRNVAERVLAEAHQRDLPPCDVIASALDEHYARLDAAS